MCIFIDSELYDYVESNKGLSYLGLNPKVLLNTGLWYYCRHPNYFGENLWWAALSLGYGYIIYVFPSSQNYYDVNIVGTPYWIVFGWLINFIVMLISIQMIETHMTTAPTTTATT